MIYCNNKKCKHRDGNKCALKDITLIYNDKNHSVRHVSCQNAEEWENIDFEKLMTGKRQNIVKSRGGYKTSRVTGVLK